MRARNSTTEEDHDARRRQARREPAIAASHSDSDATDRKTRCRKSGAMRLAKQLEKHWHDLGYPAARFWAEPIEERFAKVGTYEIYRVSEQSREWPAAALSRRMSGGSLVRAAWEASENASRAWT